MRIGIIGSGNIGQAIATLAVRAGHEVTMTNRRGGASLTAAARAVGATPGDLASAEVVFLAVPWNAIEAAVTNVTWRGRILVDATNPVLPGFLPANLGGRASSEIVASFAKDARLVKAFNTLSPSRLLTQPETGHRVLFMSGDDLAARNTVADLAISFGLAPVDLGPLAGAALLTQFPGGPLPALDLVKL